MTRAVITCGMEEVQSLIIQSKTGLMLVGNATDTGKVSVFLYLPYLPLKPLAIRTVSISIE